MFDPRRLAELAQRGEPCAVCTVVDTTGSTPRKAGASMVVLADAAESLGRVEGTIGGGAVEHELRRVALEVIAQGRARTVTLSLTTQLGMCCGGTMTFFVEPLRLRPPLVVLGAGHVGQALCRIATAAGFDVTVCDPRDELLSAERLPDAVALIEDYERDDLARAPFHPDSYVVVCTHDHRTDQDLVERALALPSHYLALVGSQRKANLTRERLRNKGFSDDDIARVICPAGLDIGAETPEEIALSIVGQMVEVRRRADAEGRRTRPQPALAPLRSSS